MIVFLPATGGALKAGMNKRNCIAVASSNNQNNLNIHFSRNAELFNSFCFISFSSVCICNLLEGTFSRSCIFPHEGYRKQASQASKSLPMQHFAISHSVDARSGGIFLHPGQLSSFLLLHSPQFFSAICF